MTHNLIGLLWRVVLVALLAMPLAGTAQQQSDPAKQQVERQATQPYNNAPVWREIRSGEPGFTTAKGPEAGVLIQNRGETWRQLRNAWLTPIGGWLIAGVVFVIGAFYAWKGQTKVHEPPTGRLIRRFTPFDRYIHWVVAITFCVLGVTGLIMMIGKHVLLPLIGYTLFAWLTILSKNVHNFVGPLFVIGLVVFIIKFAKDNLPRAYDLGWFASLGGMFGGKHVPSGKFNAGEKVWFWAGVVVLSLLVSVSGLVLNFPNFEQTREMMIVANIVHVVAAVLVMAMSLGHIFLGTIGLQGAYDAMRHGYVDEAWAKEHHQYWYEDVKSGKVKTEEAEGTPAAAHRRTA